MSGFSFRSFVLQIIPGVLILVTLTCIFFFELVFFTNSHNLKFVENSNFWIVFGVFILIISFAIGVLIDFLADVIEGVFCLFIKQPVYYLLTRKQCLGISLAHKSEILKLLCSHATLRYHPGDLFPTMELGNNLNNSFLNVFKYGYNSTLRPGSIVERVKNIYRHKIAINYLLQVTKNRCFIGCSSYQKEQMDSFFELYIFSRNMALTVLTSLLLMVFTLQNMLLLAFLTIPLIFALASYRYNLYYCRLILGSILSL